MRIVFMGTPEYAETSLRALCENGYDVVGVFTQPDKPKGRGGKMDMPPAKKYALERGIPVFQPKKIRVDGVDDLRALMPDLCVTAAFGQILSQEVLDIPKLGTVNVHASLLPEYRGSSPVNWCLMNGEKVTGVTTMLTDKGIDTGDMLLQKTLEIKPDETAGELTVRLAALGAELLIETLHRLEAGNCPRQKQDEEKMSYYPMLKKETGHISWQQDAEKIVNLVRGVNPWPCAYTGEGAEQLKIWRAEVQIDDSDAKPGTILIADAKKGLTVKAMKNAVRILTLQAPGGKQMPANDYLRGHPMQTGTMIVNGENNG